MWVGEQKQIVLVCSLYQYNMSIAIRGHYQTIFKISIIMTLGRRG